MAAKLPKMRSALRHLCLHGGDALKAHRVSPESSSSTKWRRPLVSKRVAADLRKKAIREGTYGSFNAQTGVGWDPQWDRKNNNTSSSSSSMPGSMHLRKPTKPNQQLRNREERAQRIETLLEGMDDKIENYYVEKQENKPVKNFEHIFKNLLKKSR
mmetsp:Transcript_9669/g.16140  ORF Transcript_9669/g.16140 Transcript_9669/m.16140 type:complete len:156 (-) Transcript_9669:149-616(-)